MGTLLDGKPLHWFLYPPFAFRSDRLRERTLAWMAPMEAGAPVRITNEYGEHVSFPCDEQTYERLRAYAMQGSGGITIYTQPNAAVMRWFGWLLRQAIEDKSASVSYSPGAGFRGIRWRAAPNRRGSALLLASVWGAPMGLAPGEWLQAIRRTLTTLGVGDYDTSGSLGEATLSKFWTESGHPRQWRTRGALLDLVNHYTVGGRAEARVSDAVYPSSRNLDLSSAYPVGVSRGLPFGTPRYYGRPRIDGAKHTTGNEALFGEWRLSIHDDIFYAPLPQRNVWGTGESALLWTLYEGQELTYAGWEDEIRALVATGHASAECLRGWGWERLDSFLAPWVDSLLAARYRAEEDCDPAVVAMMKQASVSTIGTWGMHGGQWDIVSKDAAQEGIDLPVELVIDRSPGVELSGLWLHQVSHEERIARPVMWSSYVRMAVRMEVWRLLQVALREGRSVLATNFDSILLAGDASLAQGTNDAATIAAQSDHPWRWKETPHGRTEVPYNRAVRFLDEEDQSRLPGLSQPIDPVHYAALIEHLRERRERDGKGVWVK